MLFRRSYDFTVRWLFILISFSSYLHSIISVRIKHIEAETKRLPFSKRYVEVRFLTKMYKIFIEFVP